VTHALKNQVPMIDRWDSFCNETSATIALQANVFYDIKMEYKQITGSAFAKLAWASQSTPKEIVPSSQVLLNLNFRSFLVSDLLARFSCTTRRKRKNLRFLLSLFQTWQMGRDQQLLAQALHWQRLALEHSLRSKPMICTTTSVVMVATYSA
jgi:hypothetical protein